MSSHKLLYETMSSHKLLYETMSSHKLLYETMEAAGSYEIMAKELGTIEADADAHSCDLVLLGRLRRETVARCMPGKDERARLAEADEYIEGWVKDLNTAIERMREVRLVQLENALRDLLQKAVAS